MIVHCGQTVPDRHGYYETHMGSRYRPFRIRKKILPWMTLIGSFQGHETAATLTAATQLDQLLSAVVSLLWFVSTRLYLFECRFDM